MTISLDDPLFRHYLEERPTLTYAQPDDPWLARPWTSSLRPAGEWNIRLNDD